MLTSNFEYFLTLQHLDAVETKNVIIPLPTDSTAKEEREDKYWGLGNNLSYPQMASLLLKLKVLVRQSL